MISRRGLALRRSRAQNRVGGFCLPQEDVIHAENLAAALAVAAFEKKAFDVVILDMRKLIDYTDIFVVCSARNRRQVQAIAEEVRRVGKSLGLTSRGTEGLEAARWVLVDLGPVVVHVFDEPLRGFYDLEGLWRDAPRLPVPDVQATEQEAPLM